MPQGSPAIAVGHRALIGGTFIVFSAFYMLTGPGRIDMIDGQYRFEVTRNLVLTGSPTIRDVRLPARVGLDGERYSFYGIGASLAALPLVRLGYWIGGEDGEVSRFLFSFTSALFSAGVLALLLHWWLRLGVRPRKALLWTVAVGVASLLWSGATSTFDQAQHAFLMLASAYAGHRSVESQRPAPWALAAGLLAGCMLLFQITFVVIAALLATSLLRTTSPSDVRAALSRLLYFAIAFLLCFLTACLYNVWRWGSPLDVGAIPGHPLWGNPLLGIAGLLVSPGKGILWFSPLVVLQIWSLPALRRQAPAVFATVVTVALTHFLFMSCFSFYGGDWCWGPRYLTVTLPLLSLGLPLLVFRRRVQRWAAGVVLSASVMVQAAGVSMDHQGFFFARALPPWFWTDQSFYFRHSPLAYRAKELWNLATLPLPPPSLPFAPSPYPAQTTYCIFGTEPSKEPQWMKRFPVFYLPRPWPFWISRLPEPMQPVPPLETAAFLLCCGATGLGLIIRYFRRSEGIAKEGADEVQ